MSASKSEIGLVIRHAYLWQSEARQGREEGVEDRPCVIIDIRENEFQELEVLKGESAQEAFCAQTRQRPR